MTASAFNATVVYIQDSKSPAEKRLAINSMKNMLSQIQTKQARLHCIAEVLVVMRTNRLPNREKLLQLVEGYDN